MKKSVNLFLILCVIAIGWVSCSDSGIAPSIEESANLGDTIDITERNLDYQSHQLWALYVGYIDPDRKVVEMIPVRDAATHFNVLSFLEGPGCAECFKITGTEFTPEGTLLADITIKHPFPTLSFSGFDVRGIMMFDGSHNFPTANVKMSDFDLGEGALVNADGYTTLYNFSTAGSGPGGLQGYLAGVLGTASAPNATLNGYKRYITPAILNNRNAFYGGNTITVQYEIALPGGPMKFGYAVDGNWAPATTSPVTNPSTDFPPQASSPEAWKIEAEVIEAQNNLNTSGGSAKINFRVFDYEGKSSYKIPVAECPELKAGQTSATLVSENAKFAEWTVTIPNTNLAGPGKYKCLIRVKEQAADSSPAYLNLTAYQIVELKVADFSGILPFALASADKLNVFAGEKIKFDGSGSYDLDNNQQKIVKYEWDFDNDGTYDAEGVNAEYFYKSDGVYQVQLRVTDDEGDTDVLDEPININVAEHGWARSWGRTDSQYVNGMTFDNDGNLLVVGGYFGTVDFDYGPGELYGFAENTDIYILKLDQYGNALSLITFGGAGNETPNGIAVDSFGNMIIGGTFTGVADLDPGPGAVSFSATNYDGFVVSLTPNGEFRWGGHITGGAVDSISSVGVFSDNTYVFAGYSNSPTVDLDPGPGELKKYGLGATDPFLIKLDNDGNLIWAKLFGGNAQDNVHSMVVDKSDNIICGGVFASLNFDFNPGGAPAVFAAAGNSDGWLAKYGSDGTYIWARTWGNTDYENFSDIGVFPSGSIFATGLFTATVDFNPDAGVDNRTAVGEQDCYLVKYDSAGTYQWVRTWGGDKFDTGTGIYASPTGSVYVTSFYQSTYIDMDPSAEELIFNSPVGTASGYSKFTASGDFVTAVGLSNNASIYAYYLIGTPNDRLFSGGIYQTNPIDLDPGPNVDLHPDPENGPDGFVIKMMDNLLW